MSDEHQPYQGPAYYEGRFTVCGRRCIGIAAPDAKSALEFFLRLIARHDLRVK